MENTILVIGNGFDLYHKLPTRYTDFLTFARYWDCFKENYDFYICDNEKNKEDNIHPIEQFNVRLNEYGKITKETMEDFAKYAICYDFSHLQYLNDNLNSNAWIKYFSHINFKKIGWIDFEHEMEKVLLIVESYYSEEITKYLNKIPNNWLPDRMSYIIECFGNKAKSPFKNLNNRTLSSKDIELDILRNQKLALLDAMKHEMDVLNQCLYYYLTEFISRIKCNVYSQQIKDLRNVYLLNFNYTYTYHAVYGKNNILEHHPIHGELRANDLVLGISDDAFTNLDYVYFQKYFQRIQKRTGSFYKEWIPIEHESLDDENVTVHIIGHSLDKTDKGILKDIFLSSFVKKIYIYYHNQLAYESQVINLIDMFRKDFVIDQTANKRIEFIELEKPIEGSAR